MSALACSRGRCGTVPAAEAAAGRSLLPSMGRSPCFPSLRPSGGARRLELGGRDPRPAARLAGLVRLRPFYLQGPSFGRAHSRRTRVSLFKALPCFL